MVVLVALLDVLRWFATCLSLVLGIRKIYRWMRRKFRKQAKNHR